MRFRAAIIISFLFLTHCAHQPSSEEGVFRLPASERIDFSFTNNRMLELEPCGCTVNPVGGLNREYNLLQNYPKETVYLTIGRSFVPIQASYQASRHDHYREKSRWLVDGLNQLGVQGLSLSLDDFLLGTEHIQSLAKRAEFPFFTTNLRALDGKKLFPTHLDFELGSHRVRVLSVAHPGDMAYPTAKTVRVLDPKKAIEEAMQSAPQNTAFVLVSGLKDQDHEKILKAFPQIQTFLRTRSAEEYHKWTDEETPRLVVNPISRGRGVVRVSLQENNGLKPAIYAAKALSKEYEAPKNKLSTLIDQYKERLRSIAMEK